MLQNCELHKICHNSWEGLTKRCKVCHQAVRDAIGFHNRDSKNSLTTISLHLLTAHSGVWMQVDSTINTRYLMTDCSWPQPHQTILLWCRHKPFLEIWSRKEMTNINSRAFLFQIELQECQNSDMIDWLLIREFDSTSYQATWKESDQDIW